MYADQVKFKGRKYRLRIIDFGGEWGVNSVASTQLNDLLFDDQCGYTCEEASFVDDLIFYFIPTHYFRLPDELLRDRILSEIV